MQVYLQYLLTSTATETCASSYEKQSFSRYRPYPGAHCSRYLVLQPPRSCGCGNHAPGSRNHGSRGHASAGIARGHHQCPKAAQGLGCSATGRAEQHQGRSPGYFNERIILSNNTEVCGRLDETSGVRVFLGLMRLIKGVQVHSFYQPHQPFSTFIDWILSGNFQAPRQ